MSEKRKSSDISEWKSDQELPPPPEKGPVGKRERELKREANPSIRFLKLLGPGLITGASDDDPSGIGTYAQAGASFGYATLWTALVTLPMMAAVQFTCAKVGLVTGMGLAGVLKRHYSPVLLYPAVLALLIANTINVAADIGAIAAATNLLLPIPIVALIIPITVTILVLLLIGSYRLIANTFKWLTLALSGYVGASILANPSWHEVLISTIVPTIIWNPIFLATLVAILGTTISPYLFFWQTSMEVEEEVSMGRRHLWQRRGTTGAELRYAAWDVGIGMVFSNLVMFFIIAGTAATLYQTGNKDIASAAEAAAALKPLAGDAAELLFAFGMIGAGMLAVPVLAGSSAYAISEVFGWKHGLGERPERAIEFYGVLAFSMIAATELNFLGINPIDALFWTAVLNGLLAPPLLILVAAIANNGKIMGNRVNGWLLNVALVVTIAAMFAAAAGLIAFWNLG